MKKFLMVAIVVAVIAGLAATPVLAAGKHGPAGKSNIGHLYLYEKDPSTWAIVDGGAWGKLKYNLSGPEFKYLFNGHDLVAGTDYSLIYYADPWPGNNPGALIDSGTANADGNLHLRGSIDLGIDLPDPTDANHPGSAKIWLVLSDDYDVGQKKLIDWNPSEYLFEHNLIAYDDTDVPSP